MSEMIERAARAIATSLEVSPESWRDHVDEARAVIQAMREPTEAMIRAGEGEIFEHRANADDWALQATKEGWEAMIDEALR